MTATSARVNPTEFAILGLLAEHPRSGYDIKKEVEGRLGHFWSESYGHLYPMLHRLHGRGLVEKRTTEQDGRPDRHVYHITAQGRDALRDWFTIPVASATRTRNELLLRLFLGRHTETVHLLRDVRGFREGIARELEELRRVRQQVATEAASHPEARHWEIVIDYGLAVYGAMVAWAERTEGTLRGQ